MNRDEIIRMAREAGAVTGVKDHLNVDGDSIVFVPEELEAFAALVAAAEREACAQVRDLLLTEKITSEWSRATHDCAVAIRARGREMTDKQPDALRLADEVMMAYSLYHACLENPERHMAALLEAAAELRRLHTSEREGWRYADELEQERKRLHEVNAELVESLREATDAIEEWGAYASEYFQNKYGLQCDIDKAKAAIAKATGENND